jgi:hypothetical protein
MLGGISETQNPAPVTDGYNYCIENIPNISVDSLMPAVSSMSFVLTLGLRLRSLKMSNGSPRRRNRRGRRRRRPRRRRRRRRRRIRRQRRRRRRRRRGGGGRRR